MNKSDVRTYLKDYGRRFRDMREQSELTQLKVAKQVGCSQAIISHIECGYMLPPPRIRGVNSWIVRK